MSDVGTARIEGLREFASAVRKLDNETAKRMRRELKQEVAEPVAQRIRSNVPVRSGNWRKAIRGGATNKGAHIVWGRSKVPYAGWMEFGGGLPSKQRRSGPPRVRRDREPEGRYVFPEIGEAREEAMEAAQRVLDRAARDARLSHRS
jgi:hypothetical protein